MRVDKLLFRPISKRSLLDDTKAISIPEKKAEKVIEISSCMIIPIVVLNFQFYGLFCVVSAGAVFSTVKTPVLLNI